MDTTNIALLNAIRISRVVRTFKVGREGGREGGMGEGKKEEPAPLREKRREGREGGRIKRDGARRTLW
jgi:hypothetical protein